jgi:hypothetical protein
MISKYGMSNTFLVSYDNDDTSRFDNPRPRVSHAHKGIHYFNTFPLRYLPSACHIEVGKKHNKTKAHDANYHCRQHASCRNILLGKYGVWNWYHTIILLPYVDTIHTIPYS